MFTQKDARDLDRLSRKIMLGTKATTKDVLRALDLKQKRYNDTLDSLSMKPRIVKLTPPPSDSFDDVVCSTDNAQ